jgi:hypothetical protein
MRNNARTVEACMTISAILSAMCASTWLLDLTILLTRLKLSQLLHALVPLPGHQPVLVHP